MTLIKYYRPPSSGGATDHAYVCVPNWINQGHQNITSHWDLELM